MRFNTTTVFEQNLGAYLHGYRRALNEGGTSSTKTYSILQILILIAAYTKRPLLISIVSETFPHLNKGVIRDFKNLMADDWDPRRWNSTNSVYTFGKGVIEFFSADQPGKVLGPRRQILYINEPNNGIPYETFDHLDTRTELFTFMDWNPAGEFWVHEKGLLNHAENKVIHSTYLDGLGVVPESYIKNILAHKDRDPNWWHVYGLGLLGKIEGLVYPFFDQVDKLPAGDAFYGIDWGYTEGNPMALTKHVIIGTDLYSQELIYELGLTNDKLAIRMDEAGVRRQYDEIFCDPEDPKSRDEIYGYGFNIKSAPGGQGSVRFGRQKVMQYKQHWTKDSLNCIKEQRNYRYITDKDGKLTEKTTHTWSHGMDSRRYAIVGRSANPPAGPVETPRDSKSELAGIRGKAF